MTTRFVFLCMFFYSGRIFAQQADQQIKSSGKAEGLVFTNWHYDFTTSVHPHNAFDLTRAYLGYKHQFDEHFAMRVVLDAERSSTISTALADSNGNITLVKTQGVFTPFVKYAYLEWNELLPHLNIELGMHATRLYKLQEAFWDHRYVYKSFADQNGFGPSSDLGLTTIVNPIGKIKGYAFAFNGEGFRKPQDPAGNNKYGAALETHPFDKLTTLVYFDEMPVTNASNQRIMVFFAGFKQSERLRVGAEYDFINHATGINRNNFNGVSAYTIIGLSKRMEGFLRFDGLRSLRDFNVATDENTYIGGVQYTPLKGIRTALSYQGVQFTTVKAEMSNMIFVNMEFGF